MERVDEWKLQALLTDVWAAAGLEVAGERYLMVAWELMFPSWLTNDYLAKWNEPSIDFVLADAAGGLHACEMKRFVVSPGDSWRALAQVTHRAAQLHETRSFEKLQTAFTLSRTHTMRNASGASSEGLNLLEHHRAFFGLDESLAPEAFTAGPVGRMVAAQRFGRAWPQALERFTSESEEAVIAHCSASYRLASSGNREMRRLSELGAWRHLVTSAVSMVHLA